jgi:adenosylhomocysteine nucleosidase
MSRVAIIAAMAGELKPLVEGWKHERRDCVDIWRYRYDEGEWVAACAGAGQAAATKAFREVEKDGAISFVISTGWAGALSEKLMPGKVYGVSGVIDALTGERLHVTRWTEERWLVTSPSVADEHEKMRLAQSYEASLVDMEAAAIARLAQMRGIPFYCFKGISDGYGDQLPDFNRFISPEGQFKLVPFILFALVRPGCWSALVRMGENSKRASIGIAETTMDLLDERAYIRKRNGYPNHNG